MSKAPLKVTVLARLGGELVWGRALVSSNQTAVGVKPAHSSSYSKQDMQLLRIAIVSPRPCSYSSQHTAAAQPPRHARPASPESLSELESGTHTRRQMQS